MNERMSETAKRRLFGVAPSLIRPLAVSLLLAFTTFQSLEATAAEISNAGNTLQDGHWIKPQRHSNTWQRLADLPDKHGVAGAFAGVSGNFVPTGGTLLVAGGANFPDAPPWQGGKKVWYDTVWALEHPGGEWRIAGRLPQRNGYGVSVSGVRGGVLCIGGGDEKRNFTDVFLMTYTNGKVSFEALPALPKPCANACGTEINGSVYVAGGVESPTSTVAMSTFWRLSLSKLADGWQEMPTWSGPPRQLAVAGNYYGNFLLCGGTSLAPGPDGKPTRTYLKDAYCYHPASNTWRRLPDMPYSPTAAPSPMFILEWDNTIHIMGGDSEASADPRTHKGFRKEFLMFKEGYDWGKAVPDEWHVYERPMPMTPRVTTPIVWWYGGRVIPSGEIRRGVRSREVWMWTP